MQLEPVVVSCPYCGESFETGVDTTAGSQIYIEDCQVCCRPIVFDLRTGAPGGEFTLSARREDD